MKTEIWTVGNSEIHDNVFRQRPELWVIICYINICVHRILNGYLLFLHEVVCGQKPELRVTIGYMKLCVNRDLNCG